MTIIRTIFLLAITACLFACNNEHVNSAPSTLLRIDTFSVVPDDAYGPGCGFSSNKVEFETSGSSILVENGVDGIAYMTINGVLTRFVQDSNGIYRNDSMELSRQVEEVGTVDYSILYKGKLMLKVKDKKPVVRDIYGVCGC
jgi:hypothetical protein